MFTLGSGFVDITRSIVLVLFTLRSGAVNIHLQTER